MNPDLLQGFRKYSGHHGLILQGDWIIVGISGGPDSMALADLLIREEASQVLAHCNFSLRGKESDQDEQFVRSFAEQKGILLETKRFDTNTYASVHGISIEMAARELRYSWFEELRIKHGCTRIAVGHHRDDSIETTLMNLIRGTGLRGLAGIRAENGSVIRPMLFTGRAEIRRYLEWRGIQFREDSTNLDNHFIRNRIRNQLIPFFEGINPGFRRNLIFEQEMYSSIQNLVDQTVEEYRTEAFSVTGETHRYHTGKLVNNRQSAVILFEILRSYGFNGFQIRDIHRALSGQSGKKFLSPTHRLITGRGELLVRPVESGIQRNYYLDPENPETFKEAGLTAEVMDNSMGPVKEQGSACIDMDRLEFPLLLRSWKAGDLFTPLGMKGKKKISDFLIDLKLDPFAKEEVRVLISGDRIVWVEGYRIDDHFRITEKTRKMLIIRRLK
jgi:tRNA(Ile)-lysidine synthase